MTTEEKTIAIDELKAKYREADADKIALMNEEDGKAYELLIDRRAKQAVRLADKAAALQRVLAFVKAIAEDDPSIMADVKIVEKAERHAAEKKAGKKRLIAPKGQKNAPLDLFKNVGDVVSEDAIYAQFKYGRGDMRRCIVDGLKKATPEARLWIAQIYQEEEISKQVLGDSFAAYDAGSYVLLGIGEHAPEGWTGYAPRAKIADTPLSSEQFAK